MKEKSTRRNFLKIVGLSSVAVNLPAISSSKEYDYQKERFDFNGFNIEFLTHNNVFVGIGNVFCNNILLRGNRLPMLPQITTPDAFEMVNFRLNEKVISGEEIRLSFKMDVKAKDTMEWMLHTVRNRRNIHDWSNPVIPAENTSLDLVLKPVERTIGGKKVSGFSYQYVYNSDSYPIYKITDRGSWEIDGSAIGNEFWLRNAKVEPVALFKNIDQFYSSEWYLPGIANPNIFQFHPLQTHFQGFTFTASKRGVLITWANKVSHVRSLFEKWRGKKEIAHIHEHCNDLTHEFNTSPVEVLWIPGDKSNVEKANIYNYVREMVHEELHTQAGMTRERVATYGIIEEWGEPDFDYYTRSGLPKLLDAGVKTVFIPNECQNAMNTYGLSNMCCNVDFKISDVIGEDKLTKFCGIAKNSGARVEMWGNTALYTIAELTLHRQGDEKRIDFLPVQGSIQEVIKNSKSPWVRNPSNAIEADHYNPRFCVFNLRDKDIREYWMKQWKYFKNDIGISGIFLDSSFNMSSDKFHFRQWPEDGNWGGATMDQTDLYGDFRPEKEPPKIIQTQYHAHLSWIAEMQQMGYHYCGEDMGVFGINRSGPDLVHRISCLSIWCDSLCDFNASKVREAGYEPIDVFFKGLAYRMMWKMYWDINQDKLDLGLEDPYAFQLLKIFNKVNHVMYSREILPDEKGVVYQNGSQQVLWAFEGFKFNLSERQKIDSMMDEQVQYSKTIDAKKNNVYLIG